MVKSKSKSVKNVKKPPAKTDASRENQLISLATDLAEQQLLDGTASVQVICHYLKLGTSKEKLEKKKLENENELLKAKVENLKSQKEIEELYKNALAAMKSYSGSESNDAENN